jgi:predicted PolB exonuclease-like 3'-5' exonuclease
MKKVELTKEELNNILKMYNEELLGTHTISLKTGISKPTINRILKENGVVFGPSGRRFTGGKKVADKKWRGKNKEYMSQKHKKWYSENKDKWNEYIKEYREKNKDKIREIKRNYERTRKANDPLYKLVANFRTAIWTVLKENNMDKYGHYFEILQYSPEELSTHLENQFTEGMEWENYGEWHVDHKTPITAFNFQEIGDNEFMKCWSLENLQPMWADENIRKSNKILL